MARTLHAVLALLLLATLSCSSDSGTTPTPPGGTAEIGPAGGTLASADGKVLVTVPAGALATTQTLSVEPLDPADHPAAWDSVDIVEAYALGPDGTTFSVPVELEFLSDQDPSRPGGGLRVEPETLYTVGAVGELEELAEVCNVADEGAKELRVCGQTTHFSPFGRGRHRDVGSPIAAIEIESTQDSPATQLEDLLPGQFSTTTTVTLRDGSRVGPAIELRGRPVEGGATALELDFRPYNYDNEGRGSLQLPYGGGEGRWGETTRAGAELRYTTTSEAVQRLQLTAIARFPDEPTGGQDPQAITGLVGPEDLEPFQFGMQSWDDRGNGELDYTIATGSFGARIYDLQAGTVAWDLGQGDWWGAVPVASPGADGDYSSGFFLYGNGGGFHIEYEAATGFDHFGQSFEPFNPVWHASAWANDPDSGGLTWVADQWSVKFAAYDAQDNMQAVGEPIFGNVLDSGTGGDIRGAFRFPGKAPHDVLLFSTGDGTNGRVYAADSSAPGAALTSIGNIGTDPRRGDVLGNVGVIANYGSNDLSTVLWTDQGASIAEASIPVGTGPVGIDMLDLGNGKHAICSAGFGSDSYSVTVVSGSTGLLVSNQQFALPQGHSQPGHTSWLQRGNETWIVISNFGSGTILPVAFDISGL